MAKQYLDEADRMFPEFGDVIEAIKKDLDTYTPEVVMLEVSDQVVQKHYGYEYRCFARIKNVSRQGKICSVHFEYYDEYGDLLLAQTRYVGRVGAGAVRVVQDTVYDGDIIARIAYYQAVVE